MKSPTATFDAFAGQYDAALQQGLDLTGESKDYFARGRLRWLRQKLERRHFHPRRVLDFGCGTGSGTPWFFEELPVESLAGSDVSEESLATARQQWGTQFNVQFTACGQEPAGHFDLAFCNGVFHHIEPSNRPAAFGQVWRALRPGGWFAFWENNPANPGTRWAMSRIPFDADAIVVWPHQARRMLRQAGFEVLLTDFVFYFPRSLAALRFLEPAFSKLPLGGQYLVLARKPGATS